MFKITDLMIKFAPSAHRMDDDFAIVGNITEPCNCTHDNCTQSCTCSACQTHDCTAGNPGSKVFSDHTPYSDELHSEGASDVGLAALRYQLSEELALSTKDMSRVR